MKARPDAYTHEHRATTPNSAGTGTWIHVQTRTHPSSWLAQRKWPVQARTSSSRRVHTQSPGVRTEKGRYRHVNQRPKAFTQVQRENTPKRAGTGKMDRRPEAYTHRQRAFTRGKGPVQARGSASSGVHPHTQSEHTENVRYMHVDPRPEAYTHEYRANTSKKAGTNAWIHVQRRTPTYTGQTHRKGQVQVSGPRSRRVHPRAPGMHTEKGQYTLQKRMNFL